MDARFLQDGFDKRLSHFIGEMGECLAAAGKLQQFGATSSNPLLPISQRESNIQWLVREMGDLSLSMARLDDSIRREFDPHHRGGGEGYVELVSEMRCHPVFMRAERRRGHDGNLIGGIEYSLYFDGRPIVMGASESTIMALAHFVKNTNAPQSREPRQ